MAQYDYTRQPLNFTTATRAQFANEVEYWKGCAQEEHELRAQAESRAAEFENELRIVNGLIENPTLQGNAPRVLWATRKAINKARERGAEEKNGKIHVWRTEVQKLSGCSESTVSDMWSKLENGGLLEKESPTTVEEGARGKKTDFSRKAYIHVSPIVERNPYVELAGAKRAGGKRIPRCKECGTNKLKVNVEKTYTCTNEACKCRGVVMNKKQVDWVSDDLLVAEREMLAEMDVTTKADLAARQAKAERQAAERRARAEEEQEQARQEEEAARMAEELARSDTPPPPRPCFHCGKEAWKWDLRTGMWACGNAANHNIATAN